MVNFELHVKRKYRVSYMTVLHRLKERYGYGNEIYPLFKAKYKEQYGKSFNRNGCRLLHSYFTGGRTRTDTGREARQILSLLRLPISPRRHKV